MATREPSRLLRRQVARALGARGPDALCALLDELQAGRVPPGFDAGFAALLDMVEEAYAQHERDLNLRTRSLEISTQELLSYNERLRDTRDAAAAAQAASRAKSEILASMSHEVRTPLNGVLGMAQLLADTELGTEQQRYLGVLHQSARSLLALLNDVLDHSRIEAGRVDLESIGFDPREHLADAVRTMAATAGRADVAVFFDVDADVPARAVCDPTRLRQVLVNLLSNALKFTERGEIELRCTADWHDGQPRLRYTVRDTGIGIPQAKLASVFEPFTQSDSSVTRRFGGAGLGLTIARGLVERMGGRLAVDSQVGRGTTFSVEVPVRVDADPAMRVPMAAGPVSVWLADTRPLVRRGLARLLVRHGTAVRAFEHARGVTEALHRNDGAAPWLLLEARSISPDGALQLARLLDQSSVRLVLLASWAPDDAERAVAAVLPGASRLRVPCSEAELLAAVGPSAAAPWRAGVLASGPGPVPPPAPTPAPPPPQRDAPIPERVGQADAGGLARLILVAEDNAVNQPFAEAILVRAGYRVTLVGDGRAALRAWAAGHFDAVLMDVQMPELDGLEATRRIRAAESGGRVARTPIAGLTANAMESDRIACLEAGMDDFVSKPVQAQDLLDCVARLLAAGAPMCAA